MSNGVKGKGKSDQTCPEGSDSLSQSGRISLQFIGKCVWSMELHIYERQWWWIISSALNK